MRQKSLIEALGVVTSELAQATVTKNVTMWLHDLSDNIFLVRQQAADDFTLLGLSTPQQLLSVGPG